VIYDFVSKSLINEISHWADKSSLSVRDRAAFDQRLFLLGSIDRELALDTKLLNGPLRKAGNLYKMKITADKQLQPHLCTGPSNHSFEYTLLSGAIERDGKLNPSNVQDQSCARRELVKEHPNERREHHKTL